MVFIYMKDLDERLALLIHNNFRHMASLRNFLMFFEYLFHGVPWFVAAFIAYFLGNEVYSAIAYILLIGRF
jgi:hypothetical protein